MSSARKQPLGRLLVEAGLLSERDLEQVLDQQHREPRRLGELLVAGHFVTSSQLTQLLSHQLSLPWISPDNIYFDEAILALIPGDLALQHCVIPVYVQRDSAGQRVLYVATDDPLEESALRACEMASGIRVRPLVGATDQLRRAILRHYFGHEPGPPAPEEWGDEEPASDARGAMWAAASARLGDSMLPPADDERGISSRPTLPGPLAVHGDSESTSDEHFEDEYERLSSRPTVVEPIPHDVLAQLQSPEIPTAPQAKPVTWGTAPPQRTLSSKPAKPPKPSRPARSPSVERDAPRAAGSSGRATPSATSPRVASSSQAVPAPKLTPPPAPSALGGRAASVPGQSSQLRPPSTASPRGSSASAQAFPPRASPSTTSAHGAPPLRPDLARSPSSTRIPRPQPRPGSSPSLPVILVAHAPRALIDLCRVVAANLPAQVEHAQLGQLSERAKVVQPIAIVVTEDVYAFDRMAFNRLALEIQSPLVLWNDDLDADYLEPLLATAFENSRMRR